MLALALASLRATRAERAANALGGPAPASALPLPVSSPSRLVPVLRRFSAFSPRGPPLPPPAARPRARAGLPALRLGRRKRSVRAARTADACGAPRVLPLALPPETAAARGCATCHILGGGRSRPAFLVVARAPRQTADATIATLRDSRPEEPAKEPANGARSEPRPVMREGQRAAGRSLRGAPRPPLLSSRPSCFPHRCTSPSRPCEHGALSIEDRPMGGPGRR